MIGSLLIALASSLSTPPRGDDGVLEAVRIPATYVAGQPYTVELVYVGGAAGVEIEAWRAGPAAFEADGVPLAKRSDGAPIVLPKGSRMTLELDLSEYIAAKGDFRLSVAGSGEERAVQVSVFQGAPKDADFMNMPAERLDDYVVLLQTNRGSIMVEFWPDKAPGHVRNFLDLSSSGFYDGILFHRVSPTFMIQGGCPNTKTNRTNTWGTGSGPRQLEAEFSDTKHVRGVLSMARGPSPNSASSQFFLMTADSFFLDGKYSVFGKMVSGFDALDQIAKARGPKASDGTARPDEPQRIERAVVLSRPGH
jgi:peptidyl-prolyl cis-trans isomerase B (cyclophilin B)